MAQSPYCNQKGVKEARQNGARSEAVVVASEARQNGALCNH
jgi:hypothetical protein